MKYAQSSTLILAFALATASTFDLRVPGAEIKSHNLNASLDQKDNRITNGNTSSVAQFPYQVGLSLFMDTLRILWCGGSLVSTTCVLTAAHCVDGAQTITIYLGGINRKVAEVSHTVSKDKVIIHSGYLRRTLKNDIALIKIPQVTLSTSIQIVPLPATATFYPSYAGDYAIASGWGKTSNGTHMAPVLQWARLEIISNVLCALTYPFILKNSNICVSTIGAVSTCDGDSGGPLVLELSGVQVGVASFGTSAGCELGHPVAFTRITSYLKWILDNQ